MDSVEGKRISLKRKAPNPVFQNEVQNLYKFARAKKSKYEPMLKEALESLSKYPLPLQSGADCAILKGFNKRLCLFLDKRLRVRHNKDSYAHWLSENVPKSQRQSNSRDGKSASNFNQRKSTGTCSQDIGNIAHASNDSCMPSLSENVPKSQRQSNFRDGKSASSFNQRKSTGTCSQDIGNIAHPSNDSCMPSLSENVPKSQRQSNSRDGKSASSLNQRKSTGTCSQDKGNIAHQSNDSWMSSLSENVPKSQTQSNSRDDKSASSLNQRKSTGTCSQEKGNIAHRSNDSCMSSLSENVPKSQTQSNSRDDKSASSLNQRKSTGTCSQDKGNIAHRSNDSCMSSLSENVPKSQTQSNSRDDKSASSLNQRKSTGTCSQDNGNIARRSNDSCMSSLSENVPKSQTQSNSRDDKSASSLNQRKSTGSCSQVTGNIAHSSKTNSISGMCCSGSRGSDASKVQKPDKPAFRSGEYAILLALLEHQNVNQINAGLTRAQLMEKAQQYSDEIFTIPKPDSFYTPWLSLNRLLKKSLLLKISGKISEYSLSEMGSEMAMELLADTKNKPAVNDMSNNAGAKTHANMISKTNQEKPLPAVMVSQRKKSEPILHMPQKTFDIILLIDKNETGGVRKKNDATVAEFKKYPDLKHEYRNLKVGDYIWIGRNKFNTNQEFVLPYVVERKRMDDLAASIKDGRFHEQKFRLRKCGLNNVIYLIENHPLNVRLPMLTLLQALANTRVQDGFKVHIGQSLNESVRFLSMMTRRLTFEFSLKSLQGHDAEPKGDVWMTFNFFNKSSIKNRTLTITETFIKLLLQLKGVSVEKALAITSVYRTPRALIKEYEQFDQKQGEALLSCIKYGNLNRNIGPTVSKSIYHFLLLKE